MFYWKEGGPPWVRVLLYENDYQRNARHLQSWAQRVNESTGPELDETFAPMRGEPAEWRRVLREEDHPQNAILEERSFDEETAREAAQRVVTLVELLRPHVETSA